MFLINPPKINREALLRLVVGVRMLSSFEILAGRPFDLPCPAGGDARLYGEDCGKARWLFATITKNYLVACWKARERCIGYVGVGPNGLIFDPPAPSSRDTLEGLWDLGTSQEDL